MFRKDFVLAPALEGVLILIVALAGWACHQPLVFASLGPTAYELVETPNRATARPYNILMGNAIALLSAFAALMLTHAWAVPSVSASGVPLLRVWATGLAAAFTVLGTLLARATQPAAVSTALLIASGVMQTWHDAAMIVAAVLLMVIAGEPLRRWREKQS
jgi:hypothetical protein